MVNVENLTVRRKGTALLEQVSLSLKNGRTTVLLGPNGAGKTTLMRVLSSYYRDYEGTVSFDGKNLKDAKKEERQALHAYLSQYLPAIRFTLEELLEFSNDRKRASFVLEELNLQSLRDKSLEEMSGGEKALSYLCLLYGQKSELYLLDEPDASLDPKARKILEKVLFSLRTQDAAILVSMHDLNRALQIADDLVVLNQGKCVFSGTKEEFLASSIPMEVFGERLEKLTREDGSALQLFL